MRRFAAILAAVVAVIASPYPLFAQYPGNPGGVQGTGVNGQCVQWTGPTTLTATGSACGSGGAGVGFPSGTPGQLLGFSGTSTPTAVTITGDCSVSSAYSITCTKTNGAVFGPFATASYDPSLNLGSGVIGVSFTPEQYGAKGNVKTFFKGAMDNNVTANLTDSTNNPFVAGDVGKLICVNGAGASGEQCGTISSVTSSSVAVLSFKNASGGAISNKQYAYATDDTTAVTNAEGAACTAGGAKVYFSKTYAMSATLAMCTTAGVSLQGTNALGDGIHFTGPGLWWAKSANDATPLSGHGLSFSGSSGVTINAGQWRLENLTIQAGIGTTNYDGGSTTSSGIATLNWNGLGMSNLDIFGWGQAGWFMDVLANSGNDYDADFDAEGIHVVSNFQGFVIGGGTTYTYTGFTQNIHIGGNSTFGSNLRDGIEIVRPIRNLTIDGASLFQASDKAGSNSYGDIVSFLPCYGCHIKGCYFEADNANERSFIEYPGTNGAQQGINLENNYFLGTIASQFGISIGTDASDPSTDSIVANNYIVGYTAGQDLLVNGTQNMVFFNNVSTSSTLDSLDVFGSAVSTPALTLSQVGLMSLQTPLPPSSGGSGIKNPTNNSILMGGGTSGFSVVTPTAAGNILVDQGSASPFADVAMSQDCTITSGGVITCLKTNNVAFGSMATIVVPFNGSSVISSVSIQPSSLATVVAAGSCTNCGITVNGAGQVTVYSNGAAGSLPTATLAGNIIIDQGSASPFADVKMGGDCTITSAGTITCTKSNGTAFGAGAFAALPLSVPNGGNATGNLTINSLIMGNGTSAVAEVTPTLAGNFVVDQGSASPFADVTMSQDCTITKAGVITCLKSNNVAFAAGAFASLPLSVANGGNATANLTSNSLLMGNGVSAVAEVTPTLAGNVVLDQGSASPFADVTMSQDCTITKAGVITCLKSNNVAFAAGAFASLPLSVPNGGVATGNLTSNSILLGNGTSAVAEVTPTLAGNVVLDQGSASPFADVTMSQDCTITKGGVITCLKTNNVAFGSAAVINVPVSVANGGSGANSLVSNAILMGNGNTSPMASITPTLAGNLLIDQGSASPFADVSMSQDCTITKGGVITCTKTQNVAFGNLATAADPLVVAHGGSGASTFPTEGVIVAQGNAAAMVAITAGPTGAPFVSNGGAATPIYTAELTIGVGGTGAQTLSAWPIATTNAQTTSTAQIVLGPSSNFWVTNQEITMSPAATVTVTFLLSTPGFANQVEQFKICESANHGNIGLPTFSPTAGMTITGSYPVCTPGAGLCCDMQIYYDTTTTAYITGSNSGPL